jgi:hypothetical protein
MLESYFADSGEYSISSRNAGNQANWRKKKPPPGESLATVWGTVGWGK